MVHCCVLLPAVQVKKMLSANAEAPINVECIMDDTDVRVRRQQQSQQPRQRVQLSRGV
jgi:molecular chaperone DnaK (HSP70)